MLPMNWENITTPIYELFIGNETSGVQGVLGNDPMLLGAFVMIVFLVLTLILGLGMLVGSVVLIPSLFSIFNYIPDLRIIVAIICGLLFGMGLHQLIRR